MFVACLFLTVFFVSAGTVCAFEAWDDTLSISGIIKNDSAWRIQDGEVGLHGPDPGVGTQKGLESGDYTMCRNTLQLEGTWTPMENLAVTAIYRAVYEASLQLDDELKQNVLDANLSSPINAGNMIDDYEYDSDLREFFVDVTWGDWHMRAGKQQIVWGEALGFRMSDIINPLDYSWHYIFPDWEDIRIPMWGLNLAHKFTEKYTLELVWLPGAFDTGFVPTKFGNAGTHWGPKGYGQLFLDSIKDSVPDNDISNSEFGLRLKALVGPWDTSLFWFYSRNDNPMFEPDWLAKANASAWASMGDKFFQFPFNHKVGGTFNYYSKQAEAVFRGECVYTFDEPYNPIDIFNVPTLGHYEKDSFSYMVAMDKNLKIPMISERNFVYISAQLEQKYIFSYDDRMTTNDMSNDDEQTIATFYIDTKYMYEKLTPSLFLMWNFTGEGWARPQIAYDIDDFWSIAVGAQIMYSHDTTEPFFGGMRDNDVAYLTVKFGF
jgi:hypothetical protein